MVVFGDSVHIKWRGHNVGGSLIAATAGKENNVHEQVLHYR